MEYVCDGKRSQGRRKNLCVKLWRNYKESFSFLSRVKLKFEFKCSTCNEGGFCLDCYKKISKHSFAFEGEEVRDMIKCPCCRSPNWYWLLKDIWLWFDGDVFTQGWEEYNILKNPCMYVYKKNRDGNYNGPCGKYSESEYLHHRVALSYTNKYWK
jgi:hypothetical protein